ncbi:MAG: lipopolysaccharide transporter permease [Phycisphaerales bacterium]|nr:lipopolysaccharide transporter permease [Phycisphaerales bacterium]
MKILDRYVIISFIKNYCISFMVLVGMYVVLDMVFNFSNLVQFQPNASAVDTLVETLRDMGDYYFYQCFLFFVHLSGIIPVVAAAFTLMRLSRFNELTAMLAAGVPLLRIAMPIVLAALLLNALLLVDQEAIIPNMIPKLVRDHDEVHKDNRKNYFDIKAMQDADDGLLYAARYYPKGTDSEASDRPRMLDLDVIQRSRVTRTRAGDDGKPVTITELLPVAHIYADQADWNPQTQQWDLVNGFRVGGLIPDDQNASQRHVPQEACPAYKSNITPEEITLYRSGNYVDLLSTERINQLLARPKSYGTLALLRVKHWRFTQPLMNVILLLLAIPCVLTREPGRLKSGATKCLIFMGLGMGSVFLTQQFAATPPTSIKPGDWAAFMAWLPIFVFGPLSVFLLERVKT